MAALRPAGAFVAGFVAFLVARLVRGQSPLGLLRVPLAVFGLMVLGFLGHNGLYVTALRYAPAAQVNLISYLWPLLMVALLALTVIAFTLHVALGGAIPAGIEPTALLAMVLIGVGPMGLANCSGTVACAMATGACSRRWPI